MPPDDVVDRLAALPLFQSVPRHELEWLVAHGERRTARAGAVLRDASTPVEETFILVAGRAGLFVDKGGASRKVLEAAAGQVLGTIPYSRFQRAPGAGVGERPAHRPPPSR